MSRIGSATPLRALSGAARPIILVTGTRGTTPKRTPTAPGPAGLAASTPGNQPRAPPVPVSATHGVHPGPAPRRPWRSTFQTGGAAPPPDSMEILRIAPAICGLAGALYLNIQFYILSEAGMSKIT